MSFKEIKTEDFTYNPFEMIGKRWLAVAGEADGKSNVMTASWGGLGVLWGKPVAFIFLRPTRYTKEFVDKADFILIMSVFAGFGGQKFIPASIERVKALKEHILRSSSDTLIEIDGGVSLDNAAVLREAGVDIAVAGSSVFKAEDPAAMIAALRQA